MTVEPSLVATPAPHPAARTVGRWGLAAVLLAAGVGHLQNTDEFLAQVPPWFPARDSVVYVSGAVELSLGAALLFGRTHRVRVGWVVAAFFVIVFPGNISQLVTRTDAFGLDSDLARSVRLLFQPLLVAWALWSTGAWHAWRQRSRSPQEE
ncbi:DoxX family protein [Sanguibacter antarcticus]|uniref:Putative membrane protein n=1 Tax=Sanguibacter antarcticus TaxID=372484 RepID=A0A2A9E7I9_9MICO|nr:MauE/DoxX family redox-associated membrane protein [Sanguibacter antarcticus]PFG34606.1 putative membrane protein [Sanguibacter antarcticus]